MLHRFAKLYFLLIAISWCAEETCAAKSCTKWDCIPYCFGHIRWTHSHYWRSQDARSCRKSYSNQEWGSFLSRCKRCKRIYRKLDAMEIMQEQYQGCTKKTFGVQSICLWESGRINIPIRNRKEWKKCLSRSMYHKSFPRNRLKASPRQWLMRCDQGFR